MFSKKTYLRIKILSLQAEARIIRREEARWVTKDGRRDHPVRMGLMAHRKQEVRPEQRAALLAYAFLRGRRYRQLEAKCRLQPNWQRVIELATKYGTEADRKIVGKQVELWAQGN